MSAEQIAAVRAMEALSGEERVALALAPAPAPLTPEDLDRYERRRAAEMELEARCDGRTWPRKLSPHDD